VVSHADSAALRTQRAAIADALFAAQQRYSDKHPDVERLKRDLAEADRRIARGGGGSAGEGEQSPQSADNPAYIQLQARLESIKLEIKGLIEARGDLKDRINTYEQRLTEAPNIEREYNDLMRGYDNAVSKYREVKDKQLEAKLAQALESERKAERFTLIEPPVVADEPVEPNRPAILMMGILGAFGAGFGNLALRELMDKGLRGAQAIQTITGAPPLAVIPQIGVPADRRRRVRRTALLAGTAAVVTVAGIVAVHFFVMPLDILWFTVLRRVEEYLPAALMFPIPGASSWSA
jgi:uncharacterized protein involved in exopolysaccharide biosynthesis